jgi:hypothetical protein
MTENASKRHNSAGRDCYYRLVPNEIAGSYWPRRPSFLQYDIVDGSRNAHDDLLHRLAVLAQQ